LSNSRKIAVYSILTIFDSARRDTSKRANDEPTTYSEYYICTSCSGKYKKTDMQQTGKIIIVAGLILIVVGIIVYFAGDKLNFLGRLPGDIRVEKENFRLYVPITTMILISIVGSVLIRIFQKFF
jgi:uncharacterized membrane protein